MPDLPPHLLIQIHGQGSAVWILGHKRQQVVGEMYRWDSVETAAMWITTNTTQGGASDAPGEGTYFAWLVREPINREDSHAVAVYLGPHHVGYIPRTVSAHWTAIIAELERRYSARVACMARTTAKTENGIHEVWLYLTTSSNKKPRMRLPDGMVIEIKPRSK